MRIRLRAWALFAGLPLLAAGSVVAQQKGEQVDPTTLYELSAQASSQKVKAGSRGSVVVALKTKNGSHVSGEAPFKIEVSGKGVKPEKEKLTLADAVEKKPVADGVADPRFDIAFVAAAAGRAALDAKVTFFICTEKICARQQKTLSVALDVD